jgi:hypothetical protein
MPTNRNIVRNCFQTSSKWWKKMGLFTANPKPVIEEQPSLHPRPTPGYKSGGNRIE